MCAQQSGIGPDNSVARPSQSNEGSSDSVDASQSRRRGRPPGSVTLTDEVAGLIVAYIQGGAFDHVAAEAAGISPRTFRDWMARGEGTHPERAPTPKLRRGAFDPTANGSDDAFVTHLNMDGSGLTYSTFLGGRSDDDGERAVPRVVIRKRPGRSRRVPGLAALLEAESGLSVPFTPFKQVSGFREHPARCRSLRSWAASVDLAFAKIPLIPFDI